jgi:hypothetical protein
MELNELIVSSIREAVKRAGGTGIVIVGAVNRKHLVTD